MNDDMKSYVVSLLETCQERRRKIALLHYELEHPARTSEAEMIGAMALGHGAGSGGGHTEGHISDKTLYIALNYRSKVDKINADTKEEIVVQLVELEQEQKRLEYGTAGNINNGLLSLINEMYSRDLSQKSKAAKRLYAQRGQCISAYPIYGYLKSPEDKRTWIPDPEAAPVVQRMFALYLEGNGPKKIAWLLNEEGVPTPAQHKRAAGSRRQLWNSERTENHWGGSTISKILHDERYTGKLIALKTTISELGNIHSAKPVERDGWVVIPGAFEAIISQETFDLAQARDVRPARKLGPMKRYLFSRKLKCGYCGAALQRHEIIQGVYYACDGRAWSGTDDCKSIRLFESDLTQAVLASIRFQAQLAKKTGKRLDRQAKNIQTAQNRAQSVQQRIQQRIAQLETQKAETYLSYDLGEISQAKYRERCIKLGAAIAEQKRRLETLEQTGGSSSLSTDIASHEEIQGLASLSNLRTLDRDMVEELIHTIRVYSGNRVEIAWNFNEEHMKPFTAEKGPDHEG